MENDLELLAWGQKVLEDYEFYNNDLNLCEDAGLIALTDELKDAIVAFQNGNGKLLTTVKASYDLKDESELEIMASGLL